MHTYIYIYIGISLSISLSLSIYIYIYMYTCVCIYIYMYVLYIYIYIYTHGLSSDRKSYSCLQCQRPENSTRSFAPTGNKTVAWNNTHNHPLILYNPSYNRYSNILLSQTSGHSFLYLRRNPIFQYYLKTCAPWSINSDSRKHTARNTATDRNQSMWMQACACMDSHARKYSGDRTNHPHPHPEHSLRLFKQSIMCSFYI